MSLLQNDSVYLVSLYASIIFMHKHVLRERVGTVLRLRLEHVLF